MLMAGQIVIVIFVLVLGVGVFYFVCKRIPKQLPDSYP